MSIPRSTKSNTRRCGGDQAKMLADIAKPSYNEVRGSPTVPPCVVAPLSRVSSVEPLSTTTTSHATLFLMNDSASKHRVKCWARFLGSDDNRDDWGHGRNGGSRRDDPACLS